MTTTAEKTLDIAQMFGEALRKSNNDMEIILRMAQLRRDKRDRLIEDEIETSQCKVRYYR